MLWVLKTYVKNDGLENIYNFMLKNFVYLNLWSKSLLFLFQEEFEKMFAVYDENVTIQYFKSFRRARANFSSPLFSANARIDLHEADMLGQRIKCYFFQVSTLYVYNSFLATL